MTGARKATGPARPARSARQRARAARAKVLDAQRARERRIEDALTLAFDRLGSLVEAQLAVAAADRELAGAVAQLAELGEGPHAIAEAMELPVKEVQRLLKLAEESPAGADAGTASVDGLDSAGAVPVAVAG
jgi:23S rRNA G2069 N7-methylase RlmK/C1962 C5-methylase RlmI